MKFETMKFWWFLNTRYEFKFRRASLVFSLNDLPIHSIQMHKKKKSELAFALFRSEVLVLILGALMSAILKWSTSCTVLRIFWKTTVDLGKESYYHVYQLIMAFLWAKYGGSHFSFHLDDLEHLLLLLFINYTL